MVSLPALVVFVVALTGTCSCFEDYNVSCEMDVHKNCDKELSIILDSEGADTWTEEDLSIYCREIVDNVDCKQMFLEKCGNESSSFQFDFLTENLRNVTQEICNETSDLRAAFRLHNACIRNSSGEYACLRPSLAQSATEVYGNPSNMTKAEKTLKFLCRTHELFTECVTASVERFCGQDAGNFIGTILTRLFANYRTRFCDEDRWRRIFAYFNI